MASEESPKPRQSIAGVRGSLEVGTVSATRSAMTMAAAAMKAKMEPQ